MAEHGFLRPNPALLDLGNLQRKKSQLAHELGEGAKCTKCGDRCSGFQLHFWRKVCINCRCGKAEHNVVDAEDHGFYFVGKIFDRPLRSREEELEFCFGATSSSSSDDDEDNCNKKNNNNKKNSESRKSKGNEKNTTHNNNKRRERTTVRVEWAPPNISKSLARRYLQELPENKVAVTGSDAAVHRKQQLEKQFPMHDIEPEQCHELTPGEVQSMVDYVANVKENVVGQGVVTEVVVQLGREELFPPPPSQDMLDELEKISLDGIKKNKEDPLPPPLPAKPKFALPSGSAGGIKMEPNGTSFQSNLSSSAHPRPRGSTSSSVGSSRNNSPSPISSGDNKSPKPKSSSKGNKQRNSNECVECRKSLSPGDVAVKADRAGEGKLWHPQCFKCYTCQEILVDLLYYYDGGHVFCARDYAANANIPRCNACDELIFATEYTGAENKAWHLKHFCCYECDKPLAGHKYIPIASQPHCLMCYQEHHGKVCKTCGEYIDPEDQRVSLGQDHWHASDQCFCCGMCHTSLLGKKMTKNDNFILCSSSCSRKVSQMLHHPERSGAIRKESPNFVSSTSS